MTLSVSKSKTAILALDFVNDIVHSEGKFAARGLPAILAEQGTIGNTKKLLEATRGKGLIVIHVARRHRAGYPDQPCHTQLDQRVKTSEALLEDGWGAEFCDELKPQPGDIVIIKRRVDAFHGTDLNLILQARGIDTLVLTGVSTNFAVEGTARTAADAGYNVLIARDCVAAVTPELSAFSLNNILPTLATVTTSTEVIAVL